VEDAGTTLAASYSIAPVTLTRAGERMLTGLSMTTMTHPDHRGRGHFPRLANEVYAAAAHAGLRAVWGFPNANSHLPFVEKLGWEDIRQIPTLTLSVDRAMLAGGTSEIMRDDEFALAYPERVATDDLVSVERTRDYLIWRYAQHPTNRYRVYSAATGGAVSSYIVVKAYGDGLDLVDIQCASPDETRALLAAVLRDAATEGCHRLYCWAPLHHWLHRTLERAGFTTDAPVTYLAARSLVDGEPWSDWLDQRTWYLQMGDSDVY
jgi:GNAT superfamily N-acetyltransferase